jgi:hypothetical protein
MGIRNKTQSPDTRDKRQRQQEEEEEQGSNERASERKPSRNPKSGARASVDGAPEARRPGPGNESRVGEGETNRG